MKFVLKGLAIAFTIFWMVFILLEYWVNHPHFKDSFRIFSYGSHVLKLVIIGSVIIGVILFFRKKYAWNWINGLCLGLFGLILMVTMSDDFYEVYFRRALTAPEKFQQILSLCGALIPVYLILMTCYVLGQWALSLRNFKLIKEDAQILAIGVGMMLLTVILFFLGVFHVMYVFVLIPVLLAILGVGWRHSLEFLQSTLIRPLPAVHQFHLVGFISVFVVIVLLCMNILTVVRPVELGFDSMTLYLKLSSLLQDYHALVKGNLPYNWSLFISLGYLIFDSLVITTTLSFSAGILCLFALYRFARKWLTPDHAMLSVMLFATMPMINWLSYMDMKVDLGLLFYLLLCMLLFVYWLRLFQGQDIRDILDRSNAATPDLKKARKPAKGNTKGITNQPTGVSGTRIGTLLSKAGPSMQVLGLIGLLLGFAIGIKLSAMIIVFPLVAVMWYAQGGKKAFFPTVLLGLFMVLFLQLDDQTGLRKLHTSTDLVQWVLLGAGVVALGYYAFTQRQTMLRLLKHTALIMACMVLPMLPWIVKNYSESRSLSITGLTQGRSEQPNLDIEELRKISSTLQKPAE